ncbi:MAG: MarR family EPS-associated transcriptional regulator [Nitrosomonadales bacterium]|nr:MarR family EPS-associated transcriptional regulator [Nitrosomonadales bacterium]
MLSDEYRYRILKRLEADPDVSQRELAGELGISLGRVNYCLQALVEKGLVKANNFRNSKNKKGYAYLLTPRGIEEKARITVQFLRIKIAEHEALKKEIKSLQREAELLLAPQNGGRTPRKIGG